MAGENPIRDAATILLSKLQLLLDDVEGGPPKTVDAMSFVELAAAAGELVSAMAKVVVC
jgi:hypothetical protein